MRNVQGYAEMADRATSYKPGDRTMVRLIVGPNTTDVTTAEVSLIEYHALKNGLLVTVIDDPESTPKAHVVCAAVNGTAAQMAAFASAMASV